MEQKKQIISKYGNVIKFIQNEYKKPIGALAKKYIYQNPISISSCDWGYSLHSRHRLLGGCPWHVKLLAHRGLVSAQYLAGAKILDEDQKKLKQDKLDVYIKWLVLAAQGGEYDAYWVLGILCNELNDYKNGFNFLNKGIEKRNINCIMAAAANFFTLRDYKTALRLYEFASEQGHYHATMACGEIYSGRRNGHNTSDFEDHKLAMKYYNKAIEMIKKNKCRKCIPRTTEETIKWHIDYMKKNL